MPAARYTDWSHVHVVGERARAQPYLGYGRKLLGYVVEDAARNGLQTHQVTKRLEDGAVVVAELRGGIPRITIVPPPPGSPVPPTTLQDDFVVWARSELLPVGIDAEHPQQILQPQDDGGWKAFVFNQEIALGRADGTYAGLFPEGLRYAGTCDWRGRDGERLSWYGPALRYWCDRWRQPSAQYGRWVFLLGRVLLDMDAYCTASEVDLPERLTLGAALRGGWLYVMQAAIADMPAPAAPVGRPYDAYATKPYPDGSVQLALRRFRVLTDAGQPLQRRWAVATGSHETLWTNDAGATVNPWVFSPDGGVCETMVAPFQPHLRRYSDTAGAYSYDLPSATHQHVRLAIAEDGAVTLSIEELGLTVGDGSGAAQECVIAADYDRDGTRLELVFGYEAFAPPLDYLAGVPGSPYADPREDFVFVPPWATYYLRIGEVRVDLFHQPGPGQEGEVWRRPLTLDIRERALVLWETRRLPSGSDFAVDVLVLRGEQIDGRIEVETFEQINGGPPFHTGWQSLVAEAGQATVSPLAMLTGSVLTGTAASPYPAGGTWPQDGISPSRVWHDTGFNPSFVFQDRGQAFGVTVFYGATGGEADSFVAFADYIAPDLFFSDRPDTLGRKHPMALAAGADALLFSGPAYRDDGSVIPVHHVSGAALPLLTGVSGASARFHNLWQLGKPPKASIP